MLFCQLLPSPIFPRIFNPKSKQILNYKTQQVQTEKISTIYYCPMLAYVELQKA